MFENDQDTILLLDALMSAVRHINSDERKTNRHIDLVDANGAVDFASSAMRDLNDLCKCENEMEFLEKQLRVNRRCHAALFFTVLKSDGIACAEASTYYEAIVHTFPSINWSFYLRLNYSCNWSEYFIECSRQLEPDILSIVIKKILRVADQKEDLKHYLWHLALQAAIHGFFILEDPSLSTCQDLRDFSFPFVHLSSTIDQNNGVSLLKTDNYNRSQLLHAFVTLLNNIITAKDISMSSTSEHEKDYEWVRIIFHAYKTIFKLLLKVTTCEGNSVKELFRLNPLLDLLTSNRAIADKLMAFKKDCWLSHYYATSSWEIGGAYLLFALGTYCQEVVFNTLPDGPKASFLEVVPDFQLMITRISLTFIGPIFRETFNCNNEYVYLLSLIISYRYPCASNAVTHLLQQHQCLTEDRILCILEKNVSIITASKSYQQLIEAVANVSSKSASQRLLAIFFQVLQAAPKDMYNKALEYILLEYGYTEKFKCENYHDMFTQFVRKTMSLQEAEAHILPLFIQSSIDVLEMLIEQALVRGPEGIILLQVLKEVPFVCSFKDGLINVLEIYFNRDLSAIEAKNLPSLITSLMEIQSTINILSFDEFLKYCIYGTIGNWNRQEIGLQCLNVSLKTLMSSNCLKISAESAVELIGRIAIIIENCIRSSNGRKKEQVLITLALLSEYLNKNGGLNDEFKTCLQSKLSKVANLNPLVEVYILQFLGMEKCKKFGSALDGYEWAYWCHTKDREHFKNALSHKEIVYDEFFEILTLVLRHFTMDEWMESSYLIEQLFKHHYPEVCASSRGWLLSKSDPHLYAVVRCLMDSLIVIIRLDDPEIQYLTSCFTNVLMTLLSKEDIHPHLLVNVFIDLCHLSSKCDSKILPTLSSLLLSFKSLVTDCVKKSQQKQYIKLFYFSIKCLPEFDGKNSLLQKFE